MKKRILATIALLSIAALSASALPPPEKDDMTLGELLANVFSLEGKVIETAVTHALSFEQTKSGKYRAFIHHHHGSSLSSEWVYIPEEGKEFFEELSEKSSRNGSTELYLLVGKKGRLEAVGERYRKSKGIYTW